MRPRSWEELRSAPSIRLKRSFPCEPSAPVHNGDSHVITAAGQEVNVRTCCGVAGIPAATVVQVRFCIQTEKTGRRKENDVLSHLVFSQNMNNYSPEFRIFSEKLTSGVKVLRSELLMSGFDCFSNLHLN